MLTHQIQKTLNNKIEYYQGKLNDLKDEIEELNENYLEVPFELWENHEYYENKLSGYLECLMTIFPDFFTTPDIPNPQADGEEEIRREEEG